MDSTRRDALKSALAAALASSAPLSVFRALAAGGPFHLPLADGTSLEITEHTITHVKPGPKPNERATRTVVVNGDFRMKGNTPLAVRGGVLQSVGNGGTDIFIEFKEGSVFIEFKANPDPGAQKVRGTAPSAAQALKMRSWNFKNNATGETMLFRGQ